MECLKLLTLVDNFILDGWEFHSFGPRYLQHQNDIKKTWDGIRNILNVSKKKSSNIDKIVYKDIIYTSNADKSNALNDFIVNIGSTVEAKIPLGKKKFSDYLDNPHIHSIFLKQWELEEVSDIITKLQASKACWPQHYSNTCS